MWTTLRRRTENRAGVTIVASLREGRVDLAGRILGSRLQDVGSPNDGWCPVTIEYPDIESVRQLLQLGNHIEVTAPPSARQRVHELATDLAQRHRPSTT